MRLTWYSNSVPLQIVVGCRLLVVVLAKKMQVEYELLPVAILVLFHGTQAERFAQRLVRQITLFALSVAFAVRL